MTEDQAREKRCPFVRYIGTVDGTPKGISGDVTCCIASDCMAWRETSYADSRLQQWDDGYCGLAGKP